VPEELFDIVKDPGCLRNLADDPAFARTKEELSRQLLDYLKQTGDPRATGNGDVWETYPRYSPIRKFPPPDTN
jgi:N-sulfoglucosamine sulfohydrolase